MDKMSIIKELMDQLIDDMEMKPEDFDERLGRKKPEVEVLKIEGKLDPSKMKGEDLSEEELEDMEDEEMHEDADQDMEMLEQSAEESPEDELKRRLMKLRG